MVGLTAGLALASTAATVGGALAGAGREAAGAAATDAARARAFGISVKELRKRERASGKARDRAMRQQARLLNIEQRQRIAGTSQMLGLLGGTQPLTGTMIDYRRFAPQEKYVPGKPAVPGRWVGGNPKGGWIKATATRPGHREGAKWIPPKPAVPQQGFPPGTFANIPIDAAIPAPAGGDLFTQAREQYGEDFDAAMMRSAQSIAQARGAVTADNQDIIAAHNKYFNELNRFSTQEFSENELALLRGLAGPEEERQRQAQESRLFAQGRLGTTGGAGEQQAFMDAQRQADLARQIQAITGGREERQNLFNLAFSDPYQSYINTLSGIERVGQAERGALSQGLVGAQGALEAGQLQALAQQYGDFYGRQAQRPLDFSDLVGELSRQRQASNLDYGRLLTDLYAGAPTPTPRGPGAGEIFLGATGRLLGSMTQQQWDREKEDRLFGLYRDIYK